MPAVDVILLTNLIREDTVKKISLRHTRNHALTLPFHQGMDQGPEHNREPHRPRRGDPQQPHLRGGRRAGVRGPLLRRVLRPRGEQVVADRGHEPAPVRVRPLRPRRVPVRDGRVDGREHRLRHRAVRPPAGQVGGGGEHAGAAVQHGGGRLRGAGLYGGGMFGDHAVPEGRGELQSEDAGVEESGAAVHAALADGGRRGGGFLVRRRGEFQGSGLE